MTLNDVDKLSMIESDALSIGGEDIRLSIVYYDAQPKVDIFVTDNHDLAEHVFKKVRPHIVEGIELAEAHELAKQYAEDWYTGDD